MYPEKKHLPNKKKMPLRIQRHINQNRKMDSFIHIDITPFEKLRIKTGDPLFLTRTTIYGIYYICCIGNYLQIVKEQLALIQQSGLLLKTQTLFCFICQYKEEIMDLFQPYLSKIHIISTNENKYEKFALENFRSYLPSTMYYYLYYFHTKGVSRDPHKEGVYHERRRNLDFFILEQHDICMFWLDHQYDAVGTTLSLYPAVHFSGNFWWTTSRHLARLSPTLRDTYYAPEMYICSYPDGKYISLCQTTNDKTVDEYRLLTKEKILYQSTNIPLKNIGCRHVEF